MRRAILFEGFHCWSKGNVLVYLVATSRKEGVGSCQTLALNGSMLLVWPCGIECSFGSGMFRSVKDRHWG